MVLQSFGGTGEVDAAGCSMKVAARTDVGCRRQNNEDSFAYDTELRLFAVSDGMGGSAGGEVASQTTVEQLVAAYRGWRAPGSGEPAAMDDALHRSVLAANAAVYERAENEPGLRGMGATLVALAFEQGSAVIANVGDSRAYLLRQGTAVQITLDHSLVAEQVRAGVLTPEQAAVSPLQSTITRAMGIGPEVQVDLFAAQLEAGDRILLTTLELRFPSLSRRAGRACSAMLTSIDGPEAFALPGLVCERLSSLCRFIESRAAGGDEIFRANIEAGHVELYRRDIEYVRKHSKLFANAADSTLFL